MEYLKNGIFGYMDRYGTMYIAQCTLHVSNMIAANIFFVFLHRTQEEHLIICINIILNNGKEWMEKEIQPMDARLAY